MKKYLGILLCLGLAACAPSDRLIAPYGDEVANAKVALENGKIIRQLKNADYILIGEKHDNAEHHKVQQALLEELVGENDIVVFEMLKSKQQSIIDRYQKGEISFDKLPAQLNWEKSGWGSWDFYGPLFRAVNANTGKILAGSVGRKDDLSKLTKLAAKVKNVPEEMQTGLRRDIIEGHCNLLPDEMVPLMVSIQMGKDALFARKLAEKPENQKAFLIAGNGHVRKDRGVPFYLARMAPTANIQVLGLIEDKDKTALKDPFPQYDTVWITGSVEEKDYCKELRERFGKKS